MLRCSWNVTMCSAYFWTWASHVAGLRYGWLYVGLRSRQVWRRSNSASCRRFYRPSSGCRRREKMTQSDDGRNVLYRNARSAAACSVALAPFERERLKNWFLEELTLQSRTSETLFAAAIACIPQVGLPFALRKRRASATTSGQSSACDFRPPNFLPVWWPEYPRR